MPSVLGVTAGSVLHSTAPDVNAPGACIARTPGPCIGDPEAGQRAIHALVVEVYPLLPLLPSMRGWSRSKLRRRFGDWHRERYPGYWQWWREHRAERRLAIEKMRATLTYADPTGNTATIRADDAEERKKRR
jgi:hypothetical protein